MLISILSVILNAVFCVVLNTEIYTDRARMADGRVREWHRSPVVRLNIMDRSALYYLQLLFVAVSVITSVLILLGVKSSIVKTIQIISTAASVITFIVIMIVTSNSHANYV